MISQQALHQLDAHAAKYAAFGAVIDKIRQTYKEK
jgi:hypothetical protein